MSNNPPPKTTPTSSEGPHRNILRNIITVNFFYRAFGAGFMFLVPLFAIHKGWTEQYYGLVISIGGYASMAVAFFWGIWLILDSNER